MKLDELFDMQIKKKKICISNFTEHLNKYYINFIY